MTLVVLLVLAALWAVVLVAAVAASPTTDRSADSIGDFNHRLDVLGKTNADRDAAPRPHCSGSAYIDAGRADVRVAGLAPRSVQPKRRRDVLRALVVAVTRHVRARVLHGRARTLGCACCSPT